MQFRNEPQPTLALVHGGGGQPTPQHVYLVLPAREPCPLTRIRTYEQLAAIVGHQRGIPLPADRTVFTDRGHFEEFSWLYGVGSLKASTQYGFPLSVMSVGSNFHGLTDPLPVMHAKMSLELGRQLHNSSNCYALWRLAHSRQFPDIAIEAGNTRLTLSQLFNVLGDFPATVKVETGFGKVQRVAADDKDSPATSYNLLPADNVTVADMLRQVRSALDSEDYNRQHENLCYYEGELMTVDVLRSLPTVQAAQAVEDIILDVDEQTQVAAERTDSGDQT